MDQFKKDISVSLVSVASDVVSTLLDKYNTVLRELLDKHAPQKTKMVIVRPKVPWYMNTIRDVKKQKRHLVRKMNKSGLEVDKQHYKEQYKLYNKALQHSKCDYYRNEVSGCDDKQLFRLVQKQRTPDSSTTL